MMDDLTIAFAQRLDEAGLTVEQGISAAESLAEELVGMAEDRAAYAPRGNDDAS